MVLVNRNSVLDLPGLRSDKPDPGGSPDTELRMRALASAIEKMDEREKTFLSHGTFNSTSSNDEPSPRQLLTPRTRHSSPRVRITRASKRLSLMDENNTTILNATVPFTNKNSAISNSYASPRQYLLSASHMSRENSVLTNKKRPLKPVNGTLNINAGFDYDEFEETQLENLKNFKPQPNRLFTTKDVYIKACSGLGIVPSQAYLRQVENNRGISMANASLSHRTIRPIAISLVRDHVCLSLDVSGNDIGPLGISYIAEMLCENDTIYELNLSGTNPGVTGLEALSKIMQNNKSLNVLRLESNLFDHTETKVIVDILRVSPHLAELYLGHNKLGYEGARMLAKEMETNTTLRTLDLQWNHFRKDSAKVFCDALKLNTGLRCLNVSWNGLGKEGCIALARSLPKNNSLKEIDLTNNRIDVVALPFLLHGLVRNSGLEILKLGKNPMTTEGAKAVVRAITGATNMSIKYLNIEDIPVDKHFKELLKKLQDSRSINVDHGIEMYSAVNMNMREHDPHDLNRFDPVMVLIEYMRIDNLRLIDLFQFFDTDNTGLVSRENLRNGVATLGLPLTEHHLDCIMKDIDRRKDGFIDLEEFMMAQKDMSKIIIQRTTRAKGKGKEDLGLKELRQILKELVEKRNQRNREKASRKTSVSFTGAVNKVKAMNDAKKMADTTVPGAIEREDTFGIPTITLSQADGAVKAEQALQLHKVRLPQIDEPIREISEVFRATLDEDIENHNILDMALDTARGEEMMMMRDMRV